MTAYSKNQTRMQNSKRVLKKIKLEHYLNTIHENAEKNNILPKSSQRELAEQALNQWNNRTVKPRTTNLTEFLRRKY